MDFEATSSYLSAMWDKKSIYPYFETYYAYSTVMNEELIKNFKCGNFNKRSANLKDLYQNSKDILCFNTCLLKKK